MSIYYIDNAAASITLPEFCIEKRDPSLCETKAPSLDAKIGLNQQDFISIFLAKYNMDYVCDIVLSGGSGLRIVTHPHETNTCFEKAAILGSWDPLNIIKVLYLESSLDGLLYAIVVPETGCFIDRDHARQSLGLQQSTFMKKAEVLPENMSFGTCSPFVLENDFVVNGGRVDKIVFDSETLSMKKEEGALDDFSFGLDHRMSIQMNYYDCFMLLKQRYPDAVIEEELMKLAFKEKLVRKNGKISIGYEFSALNYRTAKFINSIHGYGDVSIFNDYVDELSLPSVLTANGVQK